MSAAFSRSTGTTTSAFTPPASIALACSSCLAASPSADCTSTFACSSPTCVTKRSRSRCQRSSRSCAISRPILMGPVSAFFAGADDPPPQAAISAAARAATARRARDMSSAPLTVMTPALYRWPRPGSRTPRARYTLPMTRTSTTAISVASVEAIRARFPALTRRYEELPVAYFDGPGGTQVPALVVDRMTDYLLHHNANTHWHFPTSLETDAALDGARRALADFLNASPKEIAFGNNMTTITFHVARALGREWGTGDEIVVTELDHHANVAPWRALARERGVTVRTVKMRAEGQVDWDDLERVVGPKTRLVAMGAASNALGTVSDVARAAALVHARGGLMFVDAVHY